MKVDLDVLGPAPIEPGDLQHHHRRALLSLLATPDWKGEIHEDAAGVLYRLGLVTEGERKRSELHPQRWVQLCSLTVDGLALAQRLAPAKPKRAARGDMLALLRSFPALEDCPLATWDADAFAAWVHDAGLSSGGWHAALFVAAVWNPHFSRQLDRAPDRTLGRGFDLFAALRVWDDQQIAAFAVWAEAPWTL